MNFVSTVFEQGDEMLTLLPMEKTMVQCNLMKGMQSRDSCVQRETSSSITLLPTGTIKV